jgi:hypothetical protein
MALCVPDEGYSRNESCALHLISTFLFVEETRVPRENHQLAVSHWQTLLHIECASSFANTLLLRRTDVYLLLRYCHAFVRCCCTLFLLLWAFSLRCSGRISSCCSTSGTRRVNLVTNPVISREWVHPMLGGVCVASLVLYLYVCVDIGSHQWCHKGNRWCLFQFII